MDREIPLLLRASPDGEASVVGIHIWHLGGSEFSSAALRDRAGDSGADAESAPHGSKRGLDPRQRDAYVEGEALWG